MFLVGIADTMFARADMGALAEKTVQDYARKERVEVEVRRSTVPGIKDLPVACKKLFFDGKADVVIALGMVGKMPVDKVCGHEASLGMQNVQLEAMRHILEVFVHEDEAENDRELAAIMRNRTVKHARNAMDVLVHPERLKKKAGTGERQGKENAAHFSLEASSLGERL